MKGKRLDPSTRSPHVRIASRYAALLITKLRVFSLPSPAGYMKLTILTPFSVMYLMMSAFVNSLHGLPSAATSLFGLSASSVFILKVYDVIPQRYNNYPQKCTVLRINDRVPMKNPQNHMVLRILSVQRSFFPVEWSKFRVRVTP